MYYPKSQIVVDLYTNGEEFTNTSTKKPYQGFYWKTSSGQYYTGKSPQNPPNISLARIRPQNKQRTAEYENMFVDGKLPSDFDFRTTEVDLDPTKQTPNTIKNNSLIIDDNPNYKYPPVANAPITSVVFPTDNDYIIGEFQRYFLKKRNELQYLEINVETYLNYSNQVNGVQWQLYLPITIPWELTGNFDSVYKTNRNIVLLKESHSKIVGFANYFKNQFTKYFRFAEGENLYTEGNEFKNSRTNLNYIGYYHTTSEGKNIVGKRATSEMQDTLISIGENLEVGTSRRTNIAYNPNSLKRDDKRFGY